ncbi:hypothetical protein, partial [Rhodanobacter sp. 115]|uniref:hypothetical protein n=1 Tax=Rhodanobacter sp. FW021-MT20 TaxID=1162282 RepID=UPI001ED8EB12
MVAACWRARLSSCSAIVSGGISSPLSRIGKPTLAVTSEIRITAVARKIARSRAGNAEPSPSTSGRVSTPASVIAPR